MNNRQLLKGIENGNKYALCCSPSLIIREIQMKYTFKKKSFYTQFNNTNVNKLLGKNNIQLLWKEPKTVNTMEMNLAITSRVEGNQSL